MEGYILFLYGSMIENYSAFLLIPLTTACPSRRTLMKDQIREEMHFFSSICVHFPFSIRIPVVLSRDEVFGGLFTRVQQNNLSGMLENGR